ncbi:hypothetical protein ACFVAV_26320 [Nocardia sp. NPDC057663]|uniref:hypothetical protein n=1 Tax=Nocardia sp. NPDC057663 TaxID=3346201 RepID=UPI00366EE492
MLNRTVLRAAVAAAALGIALAGSGFAAAAPTADPIGRGDHPRSGSAALLSGSAEAGSAAAGSAAELAACALLEAVIPLPVCLLLV